MQRVAEFRDQTRRHLAGRAVRGGVPAAAPAQRPVHPAPCADAAHRHPLWAAERAAAAQARRHHAPLRPRLRTLHDAPEPAAELAAGSRTCPEILAELATVQMHAIQTSGNCVRNVTADHLAGIAPDEVDDPRPYCEIIRQWATLHPEFTYLPRKFKIAVTGAADRPRGLRGPRRRACTWCAMRSGSLGFRVLVGGGLGRAPMIGQVIREFLPREQLLALPGGHPARLQPPGSPRQHPQGAHQDPRQGARHRALPRAGRGGVAGQPRARAAAAARGNRARAPLLPAAALRDPRRHRCHRGARAALPGLVPLQHARASRAAATAPCSSRLKAHGAVPGDMTAAQMDALAALAERVSFGLVRATHNQNLLLADVPQRELYGGVAGARARSGSPCPTSARSPT